MVNAALDVVLIDDEPDIRQVAEIALATVGGFTVRCCNSGQQGIDAVRTSPPDLILLDVMMPEMDGPHTLQQLQSDVASRDIPVIFMTAKSQSSEVNSLLSLGAIAVIAKPFDPMTLADQISRILSEQRS